MLCSCPYLLSCSPSYEREHGAGMVNPKIQASRASQKLMCAGAPRELPSGRVTVLHCGSDGTCRLRQMAPVSEVPSAHSNSGELLIEINTGCQPA